MLSERFGSHFAQKGWINLLSWPDRYIFKDASLDNHISMTYVRHLSSLTSDIIDRWEASFKMWQSGQEKKWFVPSVRNESQNAPLAFFPLYIFWISLIKWKCTAKLEFFLQMIFFKLPQLIGYKIDFSEHPTPHLHSTGSKFTKKCQLYDYLYSKEA